MFSLDLKVLMRMTSPSVDRFFSRTEQTVSCCIVNKEAFFSLPALLAFQNAVQKRICFKVFVQSFNRFVAVSTSKCEKRSFTFCFSNVFLCKPPVFHRRWSLHCRGASHLDSRLRAPRDPINWTQGSFPLDKVHHNKAGWILNPPPTDSVQVRKKLDH